MRNLTVDLGERSYPIFIGQQLLGKSELVKPYVKGRQVLIVTNEKVAPLYLEKAEKMFAEFRCEHVILPDGEKYKNLNVLNKILDALLAQQFDRSCTLVALGGGVIGDMTGFAAAIYQRGVNFVQIPTTLLSQVDSSVGGKTGVNHPMGKNMIGAFHQPQCVIIDTDTLSTLEDRELSAGIAEVIKYGLLGNAKFFTWLENNMDKLIARDSSALAYAIEQSCTDKANIVRADEKETGVRALLNLGHTFGHAIETATGYESWLHGEAVGTGMLMAADLSQRMGWLSKEDVHRIENIIDRAYLPTRTPAHLDTETFLSLMARDKKALHGNIRLILLRAIGQAEITSDYSPVELRNTLNYYHAIAQG